MTARARDHVSCADVVALVTRYLDGDLDTASSGLVEEHLADCPHCVTYVQQTRDTAAAIGRLESPPLPQRMCDELVAAFRDWKGNR